MKVMSGDYTCDPLGEGCELILASATLNFVKDPDSFLTKIFDALYRVQAGCVPGRLRCQWAR